MIVLRLVRILAPAGVAAPVQTLDLVPVLVPIVGLPLAIAAEATVVEISVVADLQTVIDQLNAGFKKENMNG